MVCSSCASDSGGPKTDPRWRRALWIALAVNATMSWGVADAAHIDVHLRSIAAAMARIAALDIPDEVEPLFGEDIGLDGEIG